MHAHICQCKLTSPPAAAGAVRTRVCASDQRMHARASALSWRLPRRCRVYLSSPHGEPLVRELSFEVAQGRSVIIMG